MPPKQRVYTVPVYDRALTRAFQVDVENFLLKFEKFASSDFTHFAAVWKEMKFSHINSQQYYYTFIRQFVENCFFVLKKFIVYPRNIYTEIGALYLLYALYFKQLVQGWVKIRITHFEFQKLQDLLERLKKDKHKEPLFCYVKLVEAQAFEFVVLPKPLAPESRYLQNYKNYTNDTFKSKNKTNLRQKLEEKLNEGGFLDSFTNITQNYNEALSEFAVGNPGLGIFESTIIKDIDVVLKRKPSEEIKDTSWSDRRQEIKNKAMTHKAANKLDKVMVRSE